jgi:hypothetical protein
VSAGADKLLAPHGLAVVGAFHPDPGDGAPGRVRTLLLIGARGGDMWRVFRASPEFADGGADPLDRWSRRIVDGVAAEAGALALYPFGGPPYQPFQRWAARGEGAHGSPVGMQVSGTRGLWVSYRGALGFDDHLDIAPALDGNPCTGCAAPCRTACPVDAFASGSYDVARCVAHIRTAEGADCLEAGCRVRHVCPPGADAAPPPGQCGFHMAAFLRARLAAVGATP